MLPNTRFPGPSPWRPWVRSFLRRTEAKGLLGLLCRRGGAAVPLVATALTAWPTGACGGAVQLDDTPAPVAAAASGAATTAPAASADKPPTAKPATPGSSSSGPATSCKPGGPCSGSWTCTPCTDRCSPACGKLTCVAGQWAAEDLAPLPADCPRCTLPPVDVTTCTSDADCTTFDEGCYCNARPVRGVNKLYLADVMACEAAAAAECQRECLQLPGYRTTDGATTSAHAAIEAYCDTSPESGTCATRLRRR